MRIFTTKKTCAGHNRMFYELVYISLTINCCFYRPLFLPNLTPKIPIFIANSIFHFFRIARKCIRTMKENECTVKIFFFCMNGHTHATRTYSTGAKNYFTMFDLVSLHIFPCIVFNVVRLHCFFVEQIFIKLLVKRSGKS